jgi:hypothetical protein
LIIKTFETQIVAWKNQWIDDRPWEGRFSSHFSYFTVTHLIRFSESTGEITTAAKEYKKTISQFYYNYAMLVLNSFGLQNALERAPLNLGHFFGRVHTSAHTCATLVRDSLGPTGFMKYSPDSHFVQTSYAVLSLLKVRFRLKLVV